MTRRTRALLLLCLLNIPVLTSPAWAFENTYNGAWFMNMGAGYSMYRVDGDNYINPGIGWPDDHYFDTNIHNGSFVDATFGYAAISMCDWFPAIMVGLNYTYAFNGKVSGYINQYSLGQFQNYTYSYDFSRQSVMVVAKVDLFRTSYGVMPYLIAGTGASFNKASNYIEQPLANVTPRITPGYSTASNSAWASIVGAGLDWAFRDDIWVGFEYTYGDFGRVNTGNGQNTPSRTGIDYSTQHLTNKLRANSVALNFTYLINYI